jgi:hypothetical protein
MQPMNSHNAPTDVTPGRQLPDFAAGRILHCPASWASRLHVVALAISAIMLAYYLAGVVPPLGDLAARGDYGSLTYLCLVCILLPLHWPRAVYTLFVLTGAFISMDRFTRTIPEIEASSLPLISIVVTTRNEAAGLVIPLLESLLLIDYRTSRSLSSIIAI